MLKRILKFTIVFTLIFSWIFGYPPIYENFWRVRIFNFPPEIKEAKAQTADFNIQRGCALPATGVSTVTLTAGTDYTAPASNSSAFIRLVSTRLSGMGVRTLGGTQEALNFTWYISDPNFTGGTVVFSRTGTTGSDRLCWEIIEYVGAVSSANEIIVRAVGTVAYTTTGLTVDGGAVTGIVNDSDVAVFITGQNSVEVTTEAQVGAGLSTAEWVAASDIPRFTRGIANSDANSISYAVVEFTGSNWAVERIQHQFTLAGTTETETITDVGATARAFFHAQFRGATVATLDEYGAEMWLSATTTASFLLQSGATTPSDKYGVIWIVRNSDTTGGTKMNVQHISGSRATADISEGAANEEDEWTNAITAVGDTAQTSIMGESGRSAGTGAAVPRGWIALYLNSTTGVKLYTSDDGQAQNYRFQMVEWPKTTAANSVTVSATSSQVSSVISSSTDNYIGGAFTFIASSSAATVTSIKISEKGTVNAYSNLSNVKLYSQEEATCTFSGSTQLGTTQSFNASDEATFGSLNLSVGTTTQQCVFVVLDVGASAGGGNTIEIEITASGDVSVTSGSPAGTFPVQISGTTTIQGASGTVMSTEIDFDWMSGQSNWGEIIASTTETQGDVKFKVYYTSSIACDTIVPDGALPGNSSGFDVSASPINISGLSTTTYNRICLKAELTAGASASPTLNDWSVTWGAAAGTISCSTNVASTGFDMLLSSAVSTSTPNASTTMSCTYAAGCTLYVKDAGGGSNPGLWNSTSSWLIKSPNAAYSATTTLIAGTEGYGVRATTTAAGSGAALSLALRYNTGATGDLLGSVNDVGGLSLTDLTLASTTASTSSREVVVTHKAAINSVTPAGTYSDTITYSCLAN